ncbi:MAG TPA: 4Fe-4S dicluster domain-containing protein [Desulfofustis sp.]|jgi:electron transport complex protein RnfC|nr:4Fe-4S dicluster domain-containing protein [Desulfofustis sp.]HBH30659.1 4Fe-4S dicluster domain-containing protein [Desulfofustis sp.]
MKKAAPMKALLNLIGKKPAMAEMVDYDPVIREIGDPDQITLPLEYTGQVRYTPIVTVGDRVRKGQAVATSRYGNTVIASISGMVSAITSVWTPQSVHAPAIVIDKDESPPLNPEELFTGPAPAGDSEAALLRLRAAGVAPPWALPGREWEEGKMIELPRIETVIITGVRQEITVLTSQLLADQQRDKAAAALTRIGTLLPGARICLTVPDTFKHWADAFFAGIAELHYLPPSYRGRIEREVVAKILGYRIPNRLSYRDHGVAVLDMEYLLALIDALDGKAALTHKCMTISGAGLPRAITVRFPLGSSLRHILNSQGLRFSDYTRSVIDGPMKGVAQFTDQTPITHYNGLHLISGDVAPFDPIAPCINCGRCTRACPVDIQVHLINRMVEFDQIEAARGLSPEACHECGLCAHVCPAQRPIVQLLHFCNRDMIHGERYTWTPGGIS